ncbi:MAG: response regulator, partial [Calditrichia bacterium]
MKDSAKFLTMGSYNYNLLVVDDELYNLEAIERTFRNQYQVFSTTSPREALQIFKQENIHLIIADQKMPEMTGIELLEQMKLINPAPIRLVLSGYTEVEYLIEAINTGEVYRYIVKPWEPNDLTIIVQKALEAYEAQRIREQLTRDLQEKNRELHQKNAELNDTLNELQKAQQKLVEMERFGLLNKMAGMILHDLKQPLDLIRAAAESMARLDLQEADRIQAAGMIKSEVRRFLEMIHELLAYSRGDVQLDMKIMPVMEFWLLTENRLAEYAGNQQVQVLFFPEAERGEIRIDLFHLQRAVINLLRNSIQAARSRKEGGLVTVTTASGGD